MERRLFPLRWAGTTLAAVLSFNACGGGGGDGGVTNPPPPPPPAAVASVTVTLAPTTINVGQTSQATAVLRDVQGNVLTGRTVSWESMSEPVATVSATTGLVTGVGAGTTQIQASSGGRSGQAMITVAALQPPQISNLTITQNGQAANLSSVAGTLQLSFSYQVTTPFSGTITVKVDTAELYRETLNAPAMRLLPGGEALPVVVLGSRQVNIETAQTNITTAVSSQVISETPVVGNGLRNVLLTIASTTPGVAATQTVPVTLNNPPHVHGLFKANGQTAVGSDGKTWTRGDLTAAVVVAKYGNESVSGFQLQLRDVSTTYGSDPIAGVIQTITRNNFDTFTIPATAIERSDMTGVLSGFTLNGVNTVPQSQNLGNSQYTNDVIGSGFVNTPQQAQGFTPPAGKTYIQGHQLTAAQLAQVGMTGQFSVNALNLDNLGPQQASAANEPVFTFLDRMTTVGGAALWPGGSFGANNSQLSMRYELSDGVRWDRLTDKNGVDTVKTEYFAGPFSDLANLFKLQYKVGLSLSLGESLGARNYTAGIRAYDKLGNYSDYFLRTSLKNAWNISGSLNTSRLGLDTAAFGFTQGRANLNLQAMPTESVWNQSTIDPSTCWFFTVSNSLVGIPSGFLSARGKKDGAWGLGVGVSFDKYQILPSSGGSTSGSATYFLSSAIQQIYSRVGGPSNQGLYEFELKAADNAGRYIGDMMYPKSYKLLYDYTKPINTGITYNGTVTAGQPATGTLTGSDNFGLKYGRIGIRFDYNYGGFFGGQVWAPIGEVPIPAAPDSTPTKVLQMPIMGTAPIGFRFFDPVTGVIDMSNFYRSNGTSWQLEDFARNLSMITFAPFANTAPVPTISNVSSVKASISNTNWDASSTANIIDLIFNFLDPRATGTPDLSKAEWFGIPLNGGGQVYRLGAATTLTSVVEGTGRRLSYNFKYDVDNYCGPPGPMEVFAIGYNTSYWLKTNPFFIVNVKAPVRYTDNCLKLSYQF